MLWVRRVARGRRTCKYGEANEPGGVGVGGGSGGGGAARHGEVKTPMDDNTPVPFGYKGSWLALSTTDRDAVVRSLQLIDPVEVFWQAGVDAAYGIARERYGTPYRTTLKVFVSPSV